MDLIDTHCHLTGKDANHVEMVLANARAVNVTRVICIGASVGITSATEAVALAEKHNNIWATIGIHPHDAGQFRNLDQIAHLASHPRVVAIGETGLDYFRDWSPFPAQKELFANSIALARRVKKPLVIHCREAQEDTYQMLCEHNAKDVGGVFHCYAGDAEFAKRLLDINFIVSFTGNITFKKADSIRETARQIPLDYIMLETDTPYMAPEPFRGKPSEPAHVYQIAFCMAELHKVTIEEVAKVTSDNARSLFRF